MRLFLNIILISITILACYIEDFYLYFWPPRSDQAIYLSIRSRRSFNFDQQTVLDVKRKNALSQYIPVYRYTPQGVEASIKKFEAFNLFNTCPKCKSYNTKLVSGKELRLKSILIE